MQTGKLFHDVATLLKTEEPARLGPEARSGTQSIAALDEGLRDAFAKEPLTPALKDLLRSIVYLWHDHLDESHQIAQHIETADGSLVHALMHRREPDYFNAKYWFRRVGSHPSFLALAVRATELLQKHEASDLQSRLLPNKTWDPFAFVDAVEDAAEGKFPSTVALLEELQRLEFECLLENLVHRI